VEKTTPALIETPLQLRRASAPQPPDFQKNDFVVHDFVNPFPLSGAHRDAATRGEARQSQTAATGVQNKICKITLFS
jgi:hypothetical protein